MMQNAPGCHQPSNYGNDTFEFLALQLSEAQLNIFNR
jgi:hypothetical protein